MRIVCLFLLLSSAGIGFSASADSARVPIDIDQVNNPLTDIVGPDSKGAAVLRAQILLDRAHFSPAEIDGVYGDNLNRAIAAYRAANALPASDSVDAAMWAKLNQDTAPAIQEYT